MDSPLPDWTATPLRRSYERARDLDPEAQVRELIDHLENPTVLQHELLEAARAVARCCDPDDLPEDPPDESEEAGAEIVLAHFTPRREVTVWGDEPCVFTCMAGELRPAIWLPPAPDEVVGGGLDYVGLVQDCERVAVLGTAMAPGESPYVLFLRSLCAFAELLPEAQHERLDRIHFKGALGGQPVFELHLVQPAQSEACDEDEPAPGESETLLHQLTRDLADQLKGHFMGQTEFAADLGRIALLRMPEPFEGRLDVDWIA